MPLPLHGRADVLISDRPPSFDIAGWVKRNHGDGATSKADASGSGLKIAGSDPNKKEDDGIGVVISTDKDEATRRQERNAEAEMKRQQNALPAWHRISTISGDETALGLLERARAEAASANGMGVSTSSNDDILRGLGLVGARPDKQQSLTISVEEDVKPVINHEAECEFPFLAFS